MGCERRRRECEAEPSRGAKFFWALKRGVFMFYMKNEATANFRRTLNISEIPHIEKNIFIKLIFCYWVLFSVHAILNQAGLAPMLRAHFDLFTLFQLCFTGSGYCFCNTNEPEIWRGNGAPCMHRGLDISLYRLQPARPAERLGACSHVKSVWALKRGVFMVCIKIMSHPISREHSTFLKYPILRKHIDKNS